MRRKHGFWKAQGTCLINSFKRIPKKRFFYSALFDFLCLLAFLIILTSSTGLVNLISLSAVEGLNKAYELRMSGDEEGFSDLMIELAPKINRLLVLSLIIFVVALITIIFFCSWFYGRAWYSALKKRFSAKSLKQYFKLNLSWFVIWLLVLFFTIAVFKPGVAVILLLLELLVFFYLDYVLRSVFDEKKGVIHNYKAMLGIAKHVPWFLSFLIGSLIMLIILLYVLSLVVIMPVVFVVVFIISLLFFIGWSRNYIIELVQHLKYLKTRAKSG